MDILVIDDSSCQRQLIVAMIEDSGFKALCANGHVQALAILSKKNIDLILMDIEMPDMNGFELTKIIRATYAEWVPIIFISTSDSERYLAKGIAAGGDDYLTKPVKQVVLIAKICAMKRIFLMKSALERANKQLEVLSSMDSLTKLLNRRGLDNMLDVLWKKNSIGNAELSLLMIDIDFFKLYNDNYGHQQGDKCLMHVANIFNRSLDHSTDVIGRYGGEEFIVALPFTLLSDAKCKAEEIIAALFTAKIEHKYSEVMPYLSVSIGIASTNLGAKDINELINQADVALYRAKSKKRNQCAVFNSS